MASRPARVRSLKLGSGATVELDGDLMFLVDSLYQALAVGTGFSDGYAEVQSEIARVLDQMNREERDKYLAESLFFNYVSYENEKADRLLTEIAARAAEARAAARKPRLASRKSAPKSAPKAATRAQSRPPRKGGR